MTVPRAAKEPSIPWWMNGYETVTDPQQEFKDDIFYINGWANKKVPFLQLSCCV